QVGTRTPTLVAMTAMSLAAMSENRFILGLGVSGPQVIEGWHGIRFERPVQRMRETIEIVRRVVRGERVVHQGSTYQLPLKGGEGKALRSAARARPDIPIYLATLTPKSLELTGELADGWLGTSFMPEHANVFFEHIAAGAARAPRPMSAIDLHAGGAVAFSDDVHRVIARRKPRIALPPRAVGARRTHLFNRPAQRARHCAVSGG